VRPPRPHLGHAPLRVGEEVLQVGLVEQPLEQNRLHRFGPRGAGDERQRKSRDVRQRQQWVHEHDVPQPIGRGLEVVVVVGGQHDGDTRKPPVVLENPPQHVVPHARHRSGNGAVGETNRRTQPTGFLRSQFG
jgi:hypothetical protein